jgi:hypothetical protein
MCPLCTIFGVFSFVMFVLFLVTMLALDKQHEENERLVAALHVANTIWRKRLDRLEEICTGENRDEHIV